MLTLPELASIATLYTATAEGMDYLVADLAVGEGEVRGRSMLRGGEMVEVSAPIGVDVLLPGAERALLPFLRLDMCNHITLSAFYPPDEHYDVVITTGESRVVDVPAGRFAATEITVAGRSGESTYFVRAESPHFVLKVVYPGVDAVVELVELSLEGSR